MSNPIINERGKRYGRLFVYYRAKTPVGRSSAHWRCECDCGNWSTVQGGMLRMGKTVSCGCWNSEQKTAKTGKLNHSYKTGKACGRQTKEQKAFHEKIRSRDNYTCQDCGKTQKQELADIGWRLSVHHKNGDHRDNRDENAVTLCAKCHDTYTTWQREEIKDEKAQAASLIACDDSAMQELFDSLVI